MEEFIRQAITVARGMWRRRWAGVLAAWMVALIGGGVVFKMPDRYEASARVYVDTQSILKPLMSGLAVQPDIDQQIVMLSRTLISRPNIEKLIAMAELDRGRSSPVERERLIDTLSGTLQVQMRAGEPLQDLLPRHRPPRS